VQTQIAWATVHYQPLKHSPSQSHLSIFAEVTNTQWKGDTLEPQFSHISNKLPNMCCAIVALLTGRFVVCLHKWELRKCETGYYICPVWPTWTLAIFTDKQVRESKLLQLCVWGNTCEVVTFWVRNSQFNCRIIESIFDMSLVNLYKYVRQCCSCWFMSEKFTASWVFV